ncbi:hypothetical protein BKA23_0234 [Rudaeicoccus suwonensis]|uniref:Uncharacterized protein n=2 Tax=Rudaeicoccus suwonensis TaxID=657409 RepID=A0A561E771_9MICO|nr:hypothetical protein BKA23_0234 [Rudaeicoccus suwonensis]
MMQKHSLVLPYISLDSRLMTTAHGFASPDPTDRDLTRITADLNASRAMSTTRIRVRGSLLRAVRMFALRFAAMWRDHREAQERLAIMREPWTWEHAHWVPGECGMVLHGSTPPGHGRRGPVTTGGWCACHLLEAELSIERELRLQRR